MITYTIRKNRNAKRLRISINMNNEVTVTIPRFATARDANKFVHEKADWIRSRISRKTLPGSDASYQAKKEAARALATEITEQYNKIYGFHYKRIAIRNQKTRWGSCSSKSNLNFNFRIIFLPRHLAEYVVVHELCHLKEMNHSSRFWAQVAKTIPNHKDLRKELRTLKD